MTQTGLLEMLVEQLRQLQEQRKHIEGLIREHEIAIRALRPQNEGTPIPSLSRAKISARQP